MLNLLRRWVQIRLLRRRVAILERRAINVLADVWRRDPKRHQRPEVN